MWGVGVFTSALLFFEFILRLHFLPKTSRLPLTHHPELSHVVYLRILRLSLPHVRMLPALTRRILVRRPSLAQTHTRWNIRRDHVLL